MVSIFPGATTILDIGGQDSKAIALNDGGRVKKFDYINRKKLHTSSLLPHSSAP
ncbi:MAG: hypothetical protein QM498_01540 [Desulfobacterium sp.]